jgi:hypothetical protein
MATLADFIRDSGVFTFTGEKFMPKGLPSFLNKPEPPDVDSGDDNSSDEC